MAYTPEDSSCSVLGNFEKHEFRYLHSGVSKSWHVFYCIHCLKIVNQSENK